MKAPDWIPHPRGRVKPIFGRKLEIGDLIQEGDRCASPRGWTPAVAHGCQVVDGFCLYVRLAPPPSLRVLFSQEQIDALVEAARPAQAVHLRSLLLVIDPERVANTEGKV